MQRDLERGYEIGRVRRFRQGSFIATVESSRATAATLVGDAYSVSLRTTSTAPHLYTVRHTNLPAASTTSQNLRWWRRGTRTTWRCGWRNCVYSRGTCVRRPGCYEISVCRQSRCGQAQLTRFLEPLGYRKRGRTFNRDAEGGVLQVINLQMAGCPDQTIKDLDVRLPPY